MEMMQWEESKEDYRLAGAKLTVSITNKNAINTMAIPRITAL